jgi:hypothetical protein
VLAGQLLLVYRRALQVLRPTGATLDTAAIPFAELVQSNNGDWGNSLAVPLQRAGDPVKPKLVVEALDGLLAAKKEKGRSPLCVNALRVRLTRFAEAMARPLWGGCGG